MILTTERVARFSASSGATPPATPTPTHSGSSLLGIAQQFRREIGQGGWDEATRNVHELNRMNRIESPPALTEIAIALNAFGIPAYNVSMGKNPLLQVSIGRGFRVSEEVIRGEAALADRTLKHIQIPFSVRLRLPVEEALLGLSFKSAEKFFRAASAAKNEAFEGLVQDVSLRRREAVLGSWNGDVHELTSYGAEAIRTNERAFEKTKALLGEFCNSGYCPPHSGVELKGHYGRNSCLLFSVEGRDSRPETVDLMMPTAEALAVFLKDKYFSEWT